MGVVRNSMLSLQRLEEPLFEAISGFVTCLGSLNEWRMTGAVEKRNGIFKFVSEIRSFQALGVCNPGDSGRIRLSQDGSSLPISIFRGR
jgi:hypothetical protein